MKKLLNTLYVTSPDSYLSLDGENVVILENEKELGRIPLHNLEEIVSFGYRGVSPALMGSCAGRNINLCFLTPQGKFFGTGRYVSWDCPELHSGKNIQFALGTRTGDAGS